MISLQLINYIHIRMGTQDCTTHFQQLDLAIMVDLAVLTISFCIRLI